MRVSLRLLLSDKQFTEIIIHAFHPEVRYPLKRPPDVPRNLCSFIVHVNNSQDELVNSSSL